MDFSAQPGKKQVLITNVGSFLGSQLAASLIASDCQVYGVGNSHLIEPLLVKESFTLLELNLAQPLPAYLPKFDFIFDLELLKENYSLNPYNFLPHISPALANLLALVADQGTKIFVVAPITIDTVFYEYLTKGTKNENVSLILLGDLYGEGMQLKTSENELANLIRQALADQRVIIQNDGLDLIYPAYITDAILALIRFLSSEKDKGIEIIVSEEAKTALSVAYEIQSAARLALSKELNLFFGPEAAKQSSRAKVQIHLDFSPKVQLDEGLKKTFEYFKSANIQKDGEKNHHPTHTPAIVQKIDALENERRPSQLREKISQSSQSLKNISNLIPSKPKGIKLRHIFLVILVILFLTIAKTGLDLYLGVSNIREAKKQLELGNFESAQKKAKSSAGSLLSAGNKLHIFAFPLKLAGSHSAQNLDSLISGATKASEALSYFIQGGQSLKTGLAQVVSKDVKNQVIDMDATLSFFNSAYFDASLSSSLLSEAKIGIFSSKIASAQKTASNLADLSLSASELTSFFNEIVGQGQPRTYLVLLLNNNELRPGGGFIGNYALIEFDKSKLKNIAVDDIYNIDGQLKENIDPPRQLKEKLGVDKFYLRDSNWTADFPTNAQTARDFFKKETSRDVDGVITMDLSFVQDLLTQIGPLKLDGYNEEINAQNLFEKGQYYSEIGFSPGSTQKRDFFSALTRKIVDTSLQGITQNGGNNKSKSVLFAYLTATKNALEQKHTLMTIDSQNAPSFIQDKGWNPRLPPVSFNPADDSAQTRDFISIVEANLGANKVNHYIERKVDYEMTIGRDADLVGKLTITYKNNSQAETWPAGKYVNYLRVYIPFAADLFAYTDGQTTDPKSVEVTNIAGLTQFATNIEVPIKSTKTIVFTYRIPKNIKLDTAPIYHLYVQKQPGTEKDPLTFTFNLPAYLTVKSINASDEAAGKQNIAVETNLETDRDFKIELGKK